MELVVIVFLCFVGKMIYEIFKQNPNEYYPDPNRPQGSFKPPKANVNYGSYGNSYVKVPLLTAREQAAYYELRKLTDQKGLLICPKVRLLDLVNPKQDARNQRALLQKVWSKHVDFVICNQNMSVACIIELDDTTHLRQDRIERDQFVDEVLKGAGYRIIHAWSITPDIFDFIDIHIERNGPTYEEWKAQREREQRQRHQ